MTNETGTKKFTHRIINGNTGYFKFFENAGEEDFAAAFDDYLEIVTNENVTKLMVAVELKSKWSDVIEGLWLKTAELAEQFGIKKWGIVTPDSAIKKMTLKRVVNKNNFLTNPKYKFLLSQDEAEVLNWLKED